MTRNDSDTSQRPLATTGAAAVRLVLHPRFVLATIGAGLVIRLLTAVLLPVVPMSDFAWYLNRAAELAAGLGYQEGGHPTAYWPVGWPALLSIGLRLTVPPQILVPALNLAGALAIMLLILWFGRHVLASETAARLALVAYAFYPNHIAYAPIAATEIVYTALAMGAFAVFLRPSLPLRASVFAGLLFGAATLMKPQTLLFPTGAVVALALVHRGYPWHRYLRHGLVTYACLLLVLTPWAIRNTQVFGEFVLVSTNGGVALLLGANDEMTGSHFEIEQTEVWSALGVPVSERVSRQLELSSLQRAAAKKWIRENPLDYVAWMPRKTFLLWEKDTDGFWSYSATHPDAHRIVFAMQVVNQLFYMGILLLAAPAAVFALLALLGRSRAPPGLALIFCMPAFVTILAAVFTGQIRYHFPAMPFMILAAAWMTVFLVEEWAVRSRAPAPIP